MQALASELTQGRLQVRIPSLARAPKRARAGRAEPSAGASGASALRAQPEEISDDDGCQVGGVGPAG
jgi:hypothetical protein